uniref:Serine protease 36 n=1 Tax=Rousettus aegyptiacus TaxID=9407 RepID=A0A7J8F3J6_ROUAE|nr:serine protease 36 [Rousettus aegyptiacus]
MGLLWPWMAEVHVAGDRVCTGILVAPGWVLAATHCVLRWPQHLCSCARLKEAPGSSWALLFKGAGSCLPPLALKRPGSPI